MKWTRFFNSCLDSSSQRNDYLLVEVESVGNVKRYLRRIIVNNNSNNPQAEPVKYIQQFSE